MSSDINRAKSSVDPLKNISYQDLVELAKKAPAQLSSASLAESEEVKREAGLILTKKQIIDLRRYEAKGLGLPYTIKAITNYLGYGPGQDGGQDLRPVDFLETFNTIREHALKWTPLRRRIMMTGTELKLFGESIRVYGADMEKIYSLVDSTAFLDKHNIETLEQFKKITLKPGEKFPGLELKKDTVSDVGAYLGLILDEVKLKQQFAKEIKEDLDKFGEQLTSIVIPAIDLKSKAIKRNPYPGKVKALTESTEARLLEINEKTKQYKALVQKSLGSAGSLNIVGLGVAIYYGVEAEKVRRERDALRKGQEREIAKLASMNRTLGSLKRLELDMQDLMIAAIDAEQATNNLITVWNILERYVYESVKSVEKINDGLRLRLFMTHFRRVVKPWLKIEGEADELVKMFMEAEEEYQKAQGVAA